MYWGLTYSNIGEKRYFDVQNPCEFKELGKFASKNCIISAWLCMWDMLARLGSGSKYHWAASQPDVSPSLWKFPSGKKDSPPTCCFTFINWETAYCFQNFSSAETYLLGSSGSPSGQDNIDIDWLVQWSEHWTHSQWDSGVVVFKWEIILRKQLAVSVWSLQTPLHS